MTIKAILIGAVAISATTLVGCSDNPQSTVPAPAGDQGETFRKADESGNTILDIAASFAAADEPEFTILVSAVLAADSAVAADLGAKGKRTVFAPTDAAFQALFDNPDFPYTPEELLGDTDLLTTVLLYHVSPGERFSGDVADSDRIRMKRGGFTFPSVGSDVSLVDNSDITPDATIVLLDIEASNGVIHVIDQVLLP